MLFGFKMYMGVLVMLIFGQMVLAGENIVNFQRELEAYQKERKPDQTETIAREEEKVINPPLELSVGDKGKVKVKVNNDEDK